MEGVFHNSSDSITVWLVPLFFQTKVSTSPRLRWEIEKLLQTHLFRSNKLWIEQQMNKLSHLSYSHKDKQRQNAMPFSFNF